MMLPIIIGKKKEKKEKKKIRAETNSQAVQANRIALMKRNPTSAFRLFYH